MYLVPNARTGRVNAYFTLWQNAIKRNCYTHSLPIFPYRFRFVFVKQKVEPLILLCSPNFAVNSMGQQEA
jgi:hypothetical protein